MDAPALISTVIFDLDGVLIDSEQVWASAREQVVREHGGSWREGSTRAPSRHAKRPTQPGLRDLFGVPIVISTTPRHGSSLDRKFR